MHECVYKTSIRRLKSGEKKADLLGNWNLRPKEQHNDFSGFSFCFMYPILGAEEAGNMEMPISTDKREKKERKRKLH